MKPALHSGFVRTDRGQARRSPASTAESPPRRKSARDTAGSQTIGTVPLSRKNAVALPFRHPPQIGRTIPLAGEPHKKTAEDADDRAHPQRELKWAADRGALDPVP